MKKIFSVVFGILLFFGILFFLFSSFNFVGNVIKQTSSNLEVELPLDYRVVSPGGEIWFTTKLMNLASVGRRDVILKYDVFDSDNNLIVTKSETVAVETQASFVNNLLLPAKTPVGDYILRVSLLSTEKEQLTGTEISFKVSLKRGFSFYYVIFLFFAILFILVLIFYGKKILRRIRLKLQIRSIVSKKLKKGN